MERHRHERGAPEQFGRGAGDGLGGHRVGDGEGAPVLERAHEVAGRALVGDGRPSAYTPQLGRLGSEGSQRAPAVEATRLARPGPAATAPAERRGEQRGEAGKGACDHRSSMTRAV